jgi:uncharacterized protein (TIGR04255 family)
MANLEINLEEGFQNLLRAPIVEALIDIRARSSVPLDEASLKPQIEAELINYEFLDSHQELQHEIKLEAGQPPSQIIRLDWKGLRFRSFDKKHVAQFNRDGFVFSHLEPYQDWQQLHSEAMKLWQIYLKIVKPIAIDRLGLRFINRIQLPIGELQFDDYMESAPQPPKGLDMPFAGFMHQDTLIVPGQSYVINITKTIQPPAVDEHSGIAVILDIDVLTTQGHELDDGTELSRHLLEMRWLKNKVFFGCITDKALNLFK